MGSPLGPVLANIFVGFYEHLFESCHSPCLYLCHVDDTFSNFNSAEDARDFHLELNSLHPSLWFTMEVESGLHITLFGCTG